MMETSSSEQEDPPDPDFVEMDPTRRYGRYPEVVGKGASKTVYKAFDVLEGREVAWNQMKVRDVLRNSADFDTFTPEVHLLRTLKHKNIIKLYSSWVDKQHGNVNFITEIFTSGNLRQYRQKHKHVDMSALKNWSRQILQGLVYLHGHDPPVIHRDLKCDNIFVNGNNGEVKIGDLGLAAILTHAHSAKAIIGTPEFMSPELFGEDYNELVDIYAFGMCLLELVTFEYPYKECKNVAEIYKRVTSGVKPASLARVKDLRVKAFIEKCIVNVSERLPARELLMDSFLQSDAESKGIDAPRPRLYHHDTHFDGADANANHTDIRVAPSFSSQVFTEEGQVIDVNVIPLELWIADSEGLFKKIDFPFNIKVDTSIVVASEMVLELDLPDQDIIAIAKMIDSEIQAFIPEWIPGEYEKYGNEVMDMNNMDSELKDESSTMCCDPPSASLAPEGVPSERMYWSESSSRGVLSNSTSSITSGCRKSQSSVELDGRNCSFGSDSQADHNSDVNCSYDRSIDASFFTDGNRGDLDMDVSAVSSKSDIASPACIICKTSDFTKCDFCVSKYYGNGNHAYQNSPTDTYLSINSEELGENGPDSVEDNVKRLQSLLMEQKKERHALKEKHLQAIEKTLSEFPSDLHSRILDRCLRKVPDHEMSDLTFSKNCTSSERTSFLSYVVHLLVEDNNAEKPVDVQTDDSRDFSNSFPSVGDSSERMLLNKDHRGEFVDRDIPKIMKTKGECSNKGIAVILGDELDESRSSREKEHHVLENQTPHSSPLQSLFEYQRQPTISPFISLSFQGWFSNFTELLSRGGW